MMIANANGFVVLLLFLILSACCIPGSAKPGETNLSSKSSSESVSKMEKQIDKATKNIDKAMKNLDKALQKYFESGGAAFCIHGECEADEDDYVCSCEPGYTGQKCETDIDDSNSSSESVSEMEKQMDKATKNIDKAMKNLDKALQKYFESGGAAFCIHGECEADEDDYVCSCEPGYTGQKCETDIDECASQPCIISTICIDRVNGYDCACASGGAPTIYNRIYSIESVAAPGKYLSFDPERGDDAVKFVYGVAKFRVIIPADPCNPTPNTWRYQMISNATALDANVWVLQRNGTAGARFGLATGDDINADDFNIPAISYTKLILLDDGSILFEEAYSKSRSQPFRFLTYQDDGLYWLEDNGKESTRLFKLTSYASP